VRLGQIVLQDVLHCLSMEKTITVRLDGEQDEALTRRAKTVGKTRSAVVREILTQALLEVPLSERAGHLRGSLELPKTPKTKDAWGKHLRKQNWR
jgi:plasmid stability protein